MMKANELRIGNFVNDNFTVECVSNIQVDLDSVIQDKHIKNVFIADLKPTPITAEWLIKFGFQKDENLEEYYDSEGMFGVALNHEFHGKKSPLPLHIWDATFTGADCMFIHQLQNLYFALTGKELKLKE